MRRTPGATRKAQGPGMRAQRLARLIVGRYPREWRERYEREMLALVEQSPSCWRDVFDLARAGAWEWVSASRTVRKVAAIASALIATVAATSAAWGLQQLPIKPPTFAWAESPFLSLAFAATLFLAWTPFPLFVWWREFKYAAQRRPGTPPPVRLSREYMYGVVVYTLVLMVTLRWGWPLGARSPFSSVGGWFDWGTIVLMSVFSDLLNELARPSRPKFPLGLGSSALGSRQ
jgi:hypothetical protein